MESESVFQFGRGFSIALGAGLPLPLPQRGNWLTVDRLRQSLSTMQSFKFISSWLPQIK
jgi:hypothetical protein